MKRFVYIALAFVLIAACGASEAAGRNAWRFGVSYVQPSSSDVRDNGSGARGAKIEYSLGDTFAGETRTSEALAFLGYRHLSYSQIDVSNPTQSVTYDVDMDIYTIGTMLRFGSGANASRDGLYCGVGVGLAFGSPSVPAPVSGFGGFSSTKNSGQFEWCVLAGSNYGKIGFAEVGFTKINQDGALALTVGTRF